MSALDFGCGVGRLMRALSGYFTHCPGVDISERMVREARLTRTDPLQASIDIACVSTSSSTFGSWVTAVVSSKRRRELSRRVPFERSHAFLVLGTVEST